MYKSLNRPLNKYQQGHSNIPKKALHNYKWPCIQYKCTSKDIQHCVPMRFDKFPEMCCHLSVHAESENAQKSKQIRTNWMFIHTLNRITNETIPLRFYSE